jgi:hypothetical protein
MKNTKEDSIRMMSDTVKMTPYISDLRKKNTDIRSTKKLRKDTV